VRVYTGWLREDWNYVRFVNPGDLRVAEKTCGVSGCHAVEVRKVQTSMMTHGAMLWGAALYNNGAFPLKDPHFGESYGPDGKPQRLVTFPTPTVEESENKGVLPYLEPLQRWEIHNPETCCVSSSVEVESVRRLAIPTRRKIPASPKSS